MGWGWAKLYFLVFIFHVKVLLRGVQWGGFLRVGGKTSRERGRGRYVDRGVAG